MPKPRYEKTTYNDIRQPGLEQVPHVPKAPPGPFCNKQSVKDYREKIMPDWFEKVTEEHDKGQRLKQGQARYARDDGSPSGTPKDKTRSFKVKPVDESDGASSACYSVKSKADKKKKGAGAKNSPKSKPGGSAAKSDSDVEKSAADAEK
ncbi:uncharacterized protein LOC144180432 [Haemaphysalis longicornis]